MKTLKMILTALLLVLPLCSQAQKNLFEKYGDMSNVSSVYISRAMIESNSSLFTKDVYIAKVSGQLNSVQVLSTMDESIKKQMRKDIRALVQSSKYELLMKQKGVVVSSEFYMYRKGEKVKELIMIRDDAATLKFVYLEGDMTLNDIKRIMMYQDTSWMDCHDAEIIGAGSLAALSFLEQLPQLDRLSQLCRLDCLKDLKELER